VFKSIALSILKYIVNVTIWNDVSMDMEEEKEEAVDLWLLAKTLKKKGISNSTIERILWLYKNSK
jgi:hypothetical protein